VKAQTGDPQADKLIAIIQASCELGKAKGMAIEVPNRKETIYSFPVAPDDNALDAYLNQLTFKGGKYELSGWPERDPVCTEAQFAERVVAIGSPKNKDGVVFDYVLKKIDDNTFDWSVYGESPDRSPVRISFANNLVTLIDWNNGYSFKITYGPLDKKLADVRQQELVAKGMQYLPVGNKVWGMTLPEAKAYLKKHGLTLLVGIEDDVDHYPSGPPGNKSDPKRMIVNLIDGVIVGVWTL
jgi:hypothetical protein